LSDRKNIFEELEPDFYIDRSASAVFIPDPDGQEKETIIEEYDLFDFN